MNSETTSLFQHGWKILWKNKVLWLFSCLVLIEPLIHIILPIPKSANLPLSLLNLVVSFASIYFTFMSIAGVSFVLYYLAIGKDVDLEVAFQNSTNFFWRVVGVLFLLVLIIAPCLFIVFIASYKEPFQLANLAHGLFFLSIPLSLFAAIGYFSITEMIANNSTIGKGLKAAWTVFTYNFVSLAIIGLILAIASYTMNVSISMVAMFMQNNFDFAGLSRLDLLSPHLSLTDNNAYKLVNAIVQTGWRTYSTSIFTLAYLKYGGAKMSKRGTS